MVRARVHPHPLVIFGDAGQAKLHLSLGWLTRLTGSAGPPGGEPLSIADLTLQGELPMVSEFRAIRRLNNDCA